MKNIAIIEDDQLIAQMYRMKLESEGYNVNVAVNGMTGIEMVENTKPDLILLDLTLPDIEGDVVLDGIRHIDTALATPVVILTNLDDADAPRQIAKWDIDDYIVKANSTPRQVVGRVAEILKRRNLGDNKS